MSPSGAEDTKDEYLPWIRLQKSDLYMFLARHLEDSPECCAPSDEFNKTGIVVCESDKLQKIVAMSFSKSGLHAVQQIILYLPSSLRGCTVYLSRKPCTTCTTFLIQGSVSSVYYWPEDPEKKGDDSVVKEDIQQADHMFLRSHISSGVLLPVTSFETVKTIARKISRRKSPLNSNFKLSGDQTEDLSLVSIQSCKDTCAQHMQNALRCYYYLLECSQLKMNAPEEIVHRHALQLCYFLGARSSDPYEGVGCTLYSENGYFFGAGYNGYPIGTLYANLPIAGRSCRRNGPSKGEVVLHAEANALLFRSKTKIEETDVLYCTKPPCPDCWKLLRELKIKKIHCVKDLSKNSEDRIYSDNEEDPIFYKEWDQSKTQFIGASDSEDNQGTEEINDEDKVKYGSPIPHLMKEDVCMFLALHMENFPSEQEKPDYNTGIVICEVSKPKRIIALGCSSKDLHAVPKVLLRFPNALKGCEVYMSRMPCNKCATLLVQAQVSQVYYWPDLDITMDTNNPKNYDPLEHVHSIFINSSIAAAVYVPTIDKQRQVQILGFNSKVSQFSSNGEEVKYRYLNLKHLKEGRLKEYKKNLATAKECFQTLTSCKDEKIVILEEEESCVNNNSKYTHALQLCDLLASRSDNINGVGTVIYKEDNIVAVGYSGYPKGAVNNLFCNRDDVDFDKHAIVCAEANAIIMSSETDLHDAELITTSKPCDDCLKLIRAKKIAKVIWPVRDRNKSRGSTEDPVEGCSVGAYRW